MRSNGDDRLLSNEPLRRDRQIRNIKKYRTDDGQGWSSRAFGAYCRNDHYADHDRVDANWREEFGRCVRRQPRRDEHCRRDDGNGSK